MANDTATTRNVFLNLRAGPGTEFDVVTVLAPSTPLTILADLGVWLHVASGRFQGYAYRDFVQLDDSDEPVDVADIRPIVSSATTIVTISDEVRQHDVKRLGLNLGFYDQYGAAQYLKNVIVNPGFEAGEFASIFHVMPGATTARLQQDNWQTIWNDNQVGVGQPRGFWDGAAYEVLSGPARGRTGRIIRFTHDNNHVDQSRRYTYHLSDRGVTPAAQDAVMVRQRIEGHLGDVNPFNHADTETIRPGSPGRQSLRLLAPEPAWRAAFEYYLDSYGRSGDQSAGKLLLIEGAWRFSVWARAATQGGSLHVSFGRQSEVTFFEEKVPLTTEWQLVERIFHVPPGRDRLGDYGPDDPSPILALRLTITAQQGGWIDDLALERLEQTNPTVFTDEFVDRLRALKPGILRNWGNQLGSSLENQLVPPEARRTTGHRPQDRTAIDFHFSLHEFLELAQLIGAEPWYVIPPTWTATELRNLVAYLAAPSGGHKYADRRALLGQTEPWTAVFPTLHLEYGNEMWGSNDGADVFIGATLRGGERLAEVAHSRFNFLTESPFYAPAAERLNLIIGGQAGYAPRQKEIDTHSRRHHTIALAPYFGELDRYNDDAFNYSALFARATQDVTRGMMHQSQEYFQAVGQGTQLAVYEINFHTTTGPAPIDVRDRFVTGLAGGLALPLYMLTYLEQLGVRDQCAFTALQYSFQMDNDEYVPLWGLLRDLYGRGLERPTWLGLEMANRALRGDMLQVALAGANPGWRQAVGNGIDQPLDERFLRVFAFHEAGRYAALFFNLHLSEPQSVTIQFPAPPSPKAVLYVLTAENMDDSNEIERRVKIERRDLVNIRQMLTLNLQPHALYLLEWTGRDRAR